GRGRGGGATTGKRLDAAQAAGKPAAGKLPPTFADVERHAPAVLNGAASVDLASVLRLLSLLGELLEPGSPGGNPFAPLAEPPIQRTTEWLAAHALARVRALTGFAQRQGHWRILW